MRQARCQNQSWHVRKLLAARDTLDKFNDSSTKIGEGSQQDPLKLVLVFFLTSTFGSQKQCGHIIILVDMDSSNVRKIYSGQWRSFFLANPRGIDSPEENIYKNMNIYTHYLSIKIYMYYVYAYLLSSASTSSYDPSGIIWSQRNIPPRDLTVLDSGTQAWASLAVTLQWPKSLLCCTLLLFLFLLTWR